MGSAFLFLVHDGEQPGGGAELAGGGQHVVQAGQHGARQVSLPTVSSTASEGVVLSFRAHATALENSADPSIRIEALRMGRFRIRFQRIACGLDSGDLLLRQRLKHSLGGAAMVMRASRT